MMTPSPRIFWKGRPTETERIRKGRRESKRVREQKDKLRDITKENWTPGWMGETL